MFVFQQISLARLMKVEADSAFWQKAHTVYKERPNKAINESKDVSQQF